ncbi:2-oxoglutarate dehydrogenase complex E2 component [Savitreella phatthalungensis]
MRSANLAKCRCISRVALRQQNAPAILAAAVRSSIVVPKIYASNSLLAAQQRRTYAAKTVKVPQMAESLSEGTLKQWNKKVGDYVERDEEVATIETDKIDVSVNAPESGTITELLASEEDTVEVGQDLFKMEPGEGGASSSTSGGDEKATSEAKQPAEDKAAQEKKQDKSETPKAAEEPKKQESASAPKKQEPKPEPKQSSSAPPSQPKQQESASSTEAPAQGLRNERHVKMNRMRLRIAERLKESQNTAAFLTTFNEVDMTNVMEMRKLYKDDILKKHGVKLGFLSAFAKACCQAFKEVPAVNGAIVGPGAGDTIVYHDYVDLSVAVSTDKGLVTPIVRNIEQLDFVGIEREIAALGKKARDNKLTLEDMAGGTFTISNGGVFGSLMGTPIINLPQTAVLGLHAVKERPMAVNGQVQIRPMMYLALTYDHRLVDGREAVTFLRLVKEYVEDPRRLLLN